ncbi:MAG: sulfotransferase family protein [Gemmatimonadota bacterium]
MRRDARACPATPERPLAPDRLRFLARTPYYALRGTRARIHAGLPLAPPATDRPPVFIIGCGRSGTTLLGEIFATHPQVSYRYEPYHRWAAIDPVTDFLQLYSRGGHHCLLDAGSATPAARRRFRRLMTAPPGFTLVEKSPINALRIGYLDALAPDACFLHIVRDGADVARSISKMASVTRRMAFRPPLNEWWGVGDAKWRALQRDGQARGYYPGELSLLATDAQRGACEWLLSLREVGAWRPRLGSRLTEIRYPDLMADPWAILKAATGWLGLSCPSQWLEEAGARVNPAASRPAGRLELPPGMSADFNSMQEYFGFSSRAESAESRDDRDA